MNSLVVGAAVLAVAHVVAVSGASQSGASPGDKKPNIAVSGCLMRQGYATFIVADARLDATGEKAATAAPSPDRPSEVSQTPPKWVLDNAGVIGQHVGERVQVVGASDWVTDKSAPAASEPGGPPPELPHIYVLTVKVLAPKC